MKSPPGLIYGVEDTPPPFVLFLLGVQHVFLMSSSLVMPVALISEIGGSFEEVRSVVALTMIASGIGTALQALRLRGFGSGYLCPNVCGPNFFALSAEAAWLGGIPLMRGMTIVAGLFEFAFARVVHRLRFLFPPEITGLVVLMVAEGIIPVSVSKLLGVGFAGEPIRATSAFVGAATLLAMLLVNGLGRGKLRLYGVLVGMVVGYSLSAATGILGAADYQRLIASPWFALPALSQQWTFAFSWSLVPAYLIVSITGALKSIGNLILAEKSNDAEWTEPDMPRIGRGLMADAACVTVSGLLGGMASDTSASNVSLSVATSATSRKIGFAAGGLFALIGLSPKVGGVLSIMPAPVMGAILLFAVAFMLVSGIQIIVGTGFDPRKTIVVGASLALGLSVDVAPAVWSGVPSWLQPVFGSSLTLTTLLAVTLNQLLVRAAPRAAAPAAAATPAPAVPPR